MRERQRRRGIGVDETWFRKRAEQITVVNDLDRNDEHFPETDRRSVFDKFHREGFASLWDSQLRVARLIKSYWEGVIRAATTNVTNARSEGLNPKILGIERRACGYRNEKRFGNAIDFHVDDPNLYLEAPQSTHTKA